MGVCGGWSAAYRKAESLSCVANESGSQRPRSVRRWLEPSLLNGASAERRGLDRFDIGIGIGIALPPELGTIAPDHRHRHNGHIGKKV